MPMISVAFVSVSAMAKSPVPVATSKIFLGFLGKSIATTFFLHLMSIPPVITRFIRS